LCGLFDVDGGIDECSSGTTTFFAAVRPSSVFYNRGPDACGKVACVRRRKPLVQEIAMTAPNINGSTVIPCLLYRDAHAMIDWLCGTMGFSKKAVYTDSANRVVHAELTLGGGMLMVGSAPGKDERGAWGKLIRQPDELGRVETQSPAVNVPDPDAVYARVKAGGGEIVLDIEDKGYGGRGFTCRDPEGHLWSVGSYDPWRS
jgi:uncharacterized glyoxalase superfamily protein PhnB